MSFAAYAQTVDEYTAQAQKYGEKNQRKKVTRRVIKADPKFFAGYVVLGGAVAELERYEEAIEPATKGLELIPKNADGRADIESTLAELKAESAKCGNALVNPSKTTLRFNQFNGCLKSC